MKKYLYAGILLGTIVLTGCSGNEEIKGQLKEEITEGFSEGQAVEIESLSNKAFKLELTQEKKEELYNQYVEIVAEVSALYPNEGIFIEPLNKFKDEYFMEPEDYREFVINLTTSYIVVEPET
ncbi:hypothetical protein [Lysinibacillus sp. RC79]|uniref:hypothetical protein n=1 Tax=Lysinibacillus sp. RC79 TaxID=3156296 RepID=UPI003516F7D8